MYLCTKFQLTWRTSDFGTRICPKHMNEDLFLKIKKKLNRNKHTVIYASTKFQLICRTSDFGTKFAKKIRMRKKSEKINNKFEIRIQQCMPVPNFSRFQKCRCLGPNLPKNTLEWSIRTNPTQE